MRDKIFIKTPAKINLFLRIINQRTDGFHNIRSGVTFLDLCDEMIIELSDTQSIKYNGRFKPLSGIFENDIIVKTLDSLELTKNIKLDINIKKNIPTQAGLGSASSNAAGLIKGLENLGLIDKKDNKLFFNLGADVPACLYGNSCLITGKGEKVYPQIDFPKYYFVLVKPDIRLSTHDMYAKIKNNFVFDHQYNYRVRDLTSMHKDDFGNDFEKIAKNENKDIENLLNFLSKVEDCIYARMTGSGSCCYAVFNKREQARKALETINSKYSDLWSYIGENNVIND